MDETGFCHITVGIWMTAIFFGMTTKVAKGTMLQELVAMGKMPTLVIPVTMV
jgi:hypothetical protein